MPAIGPHIHAVTILANLFDFDVHPEIKAENSNSKLGLFFCFIAENDSIFTIISSNCCCVSMQNVCPRNSVVAPSISNNDWLNTSKLAGNVSSGSIESREKGKKNSK